MSYFTEIKIIDPSTGKAVNITDRSQMQVKLPDPVADGEQFLVAGVDLRAAENDTNDVTIQTPDTATRARLKFKFGGSEGAKLEIYESASGISGGSSLIPQNCERNSSETSVMAVTKDPTITSDGNLLLTYLAGGNYKNGVGGNSFDIILKQNEIYLLRVTSLVEFNDLFWEITWREHD